MIVIKLEPAELDLDRSTFSYNARHKDPTANKVSDIPSTRFMIQIVGCIPLHHASLGHHTDMISERKSFKLVMRYEQGGDAVIFKYVSHFRR